MVFPPPDSISQIIDQGININFVFLFLKIHAFRIEKILKDFRRTILPLLNYKKCHPYSVKIEKSIDIGLPVIIGLQFSNRLD